MNILNNKRIITIIIILSIILVMAGCGNNNHSDNNNDSGVILTHLDFEGKRVGVISGMITSALTKDDIKGTAVFYSSNEAALRDLKNRRIEGFMIDLSIARVIAAQPGNENLQVVAMPPEMFSGPLGAVSANKEIIDNFNAFLDQIKSDGILADMQSRWLEDDPDPVMPAITLTAVNGVLRIGTGGESRPFSYEDENGNLKGYSIELAKRFAEREGMGIEFITMKFQDLIPYAINNDVDLSIDAITITDARKELILFTDSIYDDLMGIITLR